MNGYGMFLPTFHLHSCWGTPQRANSNITNIISQLKLTGYLDKNSVQIEIAGEISLSEIPLIQETRRTWIVFLFGRFFFFLSALWIHHLTPSWTTRLLLRNLLIALQGLPCMWWVFLLLLFSKFSLSFLLLSIRL